MGGKNKYVNIFDSFTEPFNCTVITMNTASQPAVDEPLNSVGASAVWS